MQKSDEVLPPEIGVYQRTKTDKVNKFNIMTQMKRVIIIRLFNTSKSILSSFSQGQRRIGTFATYLRSIQIRRKENRWIYCICLFLHFFDLAANAHVPLLVYWITSQGFFTYQNSGRFALLQRVPILYLWQSNLLVINPLRKELLMR